MNKNHKVIELFREKLMRDLVIARRVIDLFRQVPTVAAIAAIAIVAVNSAWLFEGASSNCAAVEQLALRQTAVNLKASGSDPRVIWMARSMYAMSNGRAVAQAMEVKFPGVPTSIGCAGLYWWGQSQGGAP